MVYKALSQLSWLRLAHLRPPHIAMQKADHNLDHLGFPNLNRRNRLSSELSMLT